MSSSDAVYEVEKILNSRIIKNRKQYLIRWKGYDSSNDTWEPEENLAECHEALQEFFTARNAEAHKVRKKTTKTEYRRRHEGSYEYVDPKKLRPKDSFWDDLESGKVDVFATDMYSRAKRVNGHQSARSGGEANSYRPSGSSGDRWWTLDNTSDSDADGSHSAGPARITVSDAVRSKPFVGIPLNTMKRASAAMAREAAGDQEMESGELTDSEDEGTGSTEGRRRSKKKKHRHDKEYWNSKKHRKKERKEKDRKKERRDRRSEDGGSNESPSNTTHEPPEKAAVAQASSNSHMRSPSSQRSSDASSTDGLGTWRPGEKAAKRSLVEKGDAGAAKSVAPSSTTLLRGSAAPKSAVEEPRRNETVTKLPRIPRLPPCLGVSRAKTSTTKPQAPKGTGSSAKNNNTTEEEKPSESAGWTQHGATVADDCGSNEASGSLQPFSQAFADDLSDDEMSEADLRIVEETGESPHDHQETLTIVDEIGCEGAQTGGRTEANPDEPTEKIQPPPEEKPTVPSVTSIAAVTSAVTSTVTSAVPSTANSTVRADENGIHIPESSAKMPPLPIRLPIANSGPAVPASDKATPEVRPTALQKKRRSCDPMWDELDAFPVIHSLHELETTHKEEMKRLAVKRTLDEIAELVRIGDTWHVKFALEHEHCPRLDNAEQPLIFLASQKGFDDILEMLLSKKADVNKPNENGTTALMIAAEGGFITTTSILLTCGAYMNTVNAKGETAMIKAVKRGSLKTVKCLLEHGANFNAMVSEKRHAASWARQMKLTEIDQLLTNYENNIGKQIEEKAKQSLESLGEIIERILPVHVLSFWEAEEFHIWFSAKVYPVRAGEGNLLFLANAVFQEGEMRCQLRGDCFIEKVILNDVEQQSVTKTGQFVLSFSPLHDGDNKCTIFTKTVPYPSLRFIVAAFRVRLKNR